MSTRRGFFGLASFLPFWSGEAFAADPTGTNTSVPGVGQIPGTQTNDSANTGNVGEYGLASLALASAITLSNATGTSIVGVPLTGGDWDVWGVVYYHPQAATVITTKIAAISTTAGSGVAGLPGLVSGYEIQEGLGAGLTGGSDNSLHVPSARISVAGAATAFLNASLSFASSTASAYGVIQARRRR